jgi:prevent-host-death family protein
MAGKEGKRFSVAEARQNFARLIRTAERGRAVQITRRGETVAVVLSASDYVALTSDRPSFVEAVGAIRDRLDVDRLGIGDEVFEGLRGETPGREVSI